MGSSFASLTNTFLLALVAVAPVGVAILTLLVPSVLDSLRRRTPAHRIAFNVALQGLSVLAARFAYALTTGDAFFGSGAIDLGHLPGMVAAGGTYFVVNHCLLNVVFALSMKAQVLPTVLLSLRESAPVAAIETAGAVLALAVSSVFAPVALIFLAPSVWAIMRSTRFAAEIQDQAFHDRATGLPNREMLREHYAAVTEDGPADEPVRLVAIAIGVDRFAEIRAVLGHDAADQLLRDAGERLVAAANEDNLELVARLDAEVFALLTPLHDSVEEQQAEIERLTARFLACLREPFSLSGVRVDIQATAGCAVYPDHAHTAEDLFTRADNALRSAHDGGRGQLHMYDAANEVSSPAQLSLLGELRDALVTGQIEVFYQPKVATRTGVVTGVEALVRWRHPERGLVPPLDFIPLAETTGLVAPLTWEVLDQSLAQARAWLERGWEIGMSVNLAAAQLMDEETPTKVLEAMTKHGVPARLLTLEVTESSLIQDADTAIKVLSMLRALGVKISVDDYGTGYSSLAYLQKLSVDELKIDRAFVKDLAKAGNTHDLAIVESTIALGHRLYLSVVAEGVENESELEILRAAGCDVVQGYFYSPPKPGDVLTEWLAGQPLNSAAPIGELPAKAADRPHARTCDACGAQLEGHRGYLCQETSAIPLKAIPAQRTAGSSATSLPS